MASPRRRRARDRGFARILGYQWRRCVLACARQHFRSSSSMLSFRFLPLGSMLCLFHCGTNSGGAPFDSAGGSEKVFEIPELGPVTIGGDCPELRSPLDDPAVRELALERGLDLD